MQPQQAGIDWRGFHHVALVTPDLDATIAFYRDVLGMHVGETRHGGGVIPARHCFVRPGEDAATWGLHFFEHPQAEIARDPAGLRGGGFIPGALQHVAFALPDAATWGLHFFEHPGAEIARDPAGLRGGGFIPGALQHVASRFRTPPRPAVSARGWRRTAWRRRRRGASVRSRTCSSTTRTGSCWRPPGPVPRTSGPERPLPSGHAGG